MQSQDTTSFSPDAFKRHFEFVRIRCVLVCLSRLDEAVHNKRAKRVGYVYHAFFAAAAYEIGKVALSLLAYQLSRL